MVCLWTDIQIAIVQNGFNGWWQFSLKTAQQPLNVGLDIRATASSLDVSRRAPFSIRGNNLSSVIMEICVFLSLSQKQAGVHFGLGFILHRRSNIYYISIP